MTSRKEADLTCGGNQHNSSECVLRRWLLGLSIIRQPWFLLERSAMKVARYVLRGGKPERAYLSRLFNSMIHEKPYHNLNIE
jgi:hypothetical protein